MWLTRSGDFLATPNAKAIVRCVLAMALLVSPGCGAGDPMDEVREMHQGGELAASLEPLRALLESRPDDSEVLYLYGVALSGTGLFTQAVWPLRRAMEDAEWHDRAAIHLANIAVTTGDWDMATGILDPLVEEDPDNGEALLLRAFARTHSRQDYEGALADSDAVLELEPESSDALVLRGVALLGLQRIEEAGEAIEQASEHFETAGMGLAKSPRFCVVRATFAKEKAELEKAEEIFEGCLEEYPTVFLVVDEAAKFFDSLGRSDRSLEIIREAFESAPDSRSYRLSLVYRLSQRGEEEEAEALMVEATEVPQPELAASAFADLAGHYMQRERLEDAVNAFEQALALIPDPRPDFLFAYADALVAAGHFDRALELANEMTVVPHSELIRGRALLAQGRPAQALEHFSKGLELWPDNAVARYLAATAAEQLGDFDRAIEEYRYSIRAGASKSDARWRLSRLYLASGDVSSAAEVIRHDAGEDPYRSLEETLLEIELLARLGRSERMPVHVMEAIEPPQVWARAVAAIARGARATQGPEASEGVVLRATKLDLTDPAHAPALASLVVDLAAQDRGPEALARVEAALRSNPDAAAFHEVRGQALSLSGGDPDDARSAWSRATELDPASPLALRGLGSLEEAAGNADAALVFYGRATNADPYDTEAPQAAARLLVREGRIEEAVGRLELVLERSPYDGPAALELAKLLLEQDAISARNRAIVLLLGAERFGGGAEASRALADLGTGRGPTP